MNTRRFLLVMVMSIVVLAGTALARGIDGKELYRDNCRVCHDKGSAHKQYTPMTLTQAQWRSFLFGKAGVFPQECDSPKNRQEAARVAFPSK